MTRGPCVNGAASVAEERDRAVVVGGCVATAAPLFVAAGAKAAADAAASKKVVQPSFISIAEWYLFNSFCKILVRSKAMMRQQLASTGLIEEQIRAGKIAGTSVTFVS